MNKEQSGLSIAEEFTEKIREENRESKKVSAAPFIILGFLIIIMSFLVEGFFSLYNFTTILNQLAIPLALAVGLTFVIVMGSIDLSVEGVMGFVGSIVTLLVLNDKTNLNLGILGMCIAVLLGTLIGFVTGTIHVKGKLPSFMVTFVVSCIMTGFAVLSYRGIPAMVHDPLFQTLARGSFLGIPYVTCIALVLFGIGFLMQEYTAFGRYIFAIGDNESVLRNTGVNIDRIKILVFTWSGFCIGVAGVLGAIRIGRGEVLIGKDTLFPTITAVVVGGTSLSGGSGGVINSLVGALIVTIIQNAMILLGVNPYIQSAVQGIIIIAAIALFVIRRKKLVVK